ncbi:MAG: (E)-4-hydroxy-3-methylbut-2-enyl-diphosphate synthase [Bacteroidales bacterium]|jgi:(E)-4-hydroxy-3-methylbut-2-enyl-diphosphate synthase|nr:(E)-4-hydroxy-3-methylbut-2-enyl-diphosphate synthase [Bacteroidales bacterium]
MTYNMNYFERFSYVDDLFCYNRRKTWEVTVGDVPLGGTNPVRIQSMTNADTLDTAACTQQAIRMIEAGCEYVRLTVPSAAEAKNLRNIKQELRKRGYTTPLIADVHFNPNVALIAAEIVEKVRINPGNYADKKQLASSAHTTETCSTETERIAERLLPLLRVCKQNGTAIRIGTNHGSLSDRIVSRYGNSPLGMAASAMEYVQICNDFGFHALVLSMKASDTRIMLQSVRLLVAMLNEKKWYYPLHLGVTEAGNGEYGRIKSAAGIGALLHDGLGDTIRVSLTENPENELPFASILRSLHADRKSGSTSKPAAQDTVSIPVDAIKYNPYRYAKRETLSVNGTGGKHKPVVFSDAQTIEKSDRHPEAENLYIINSPEDTFPEDCILVAFHQGSFPVIGWRRLFTKPFTNPVVFRRRYETSDRQQFYAQATADVAVLAMDGFLDGIWIENPYFSADECYQISLDILQSCGLRYSKAEYISCPSCGRTQYKIEEVLEAVKNKTSHLKGLKIGVMGCIVNGPGEMSDADYGFVGSGKGKITLYKGQQPVYRNIKEENALDMLIQLIKDNGDWKIEN